MPLRPIDIPLWLRNLASKLLSYQFTRAQADYLIEEINKRVR